MQVSVLPSRELDQAFSLTASGLAEISCGVTALSRDSVELLFRMDGAQPLRAVREAMQALPTSGFALAFNALRDRDLVHVACEDFFDVQASQLSLMGKRSAGATASAASNLSVGLACRHEPRARRADEALWAVIVEDDPLLLHFLEHFLTLAGFRTRLASNRAEVIDAVRCGVPDLFILDGSLPDVDGFDILRRIRQHPQLATVPALMMTGRSSRKHILEAFGCGADGYLTKPVDADCLLQSVRAVVGLPQDAVQSAWSNRDTFRSRQAIAA